MTIPAITRIPPSPIPAPLPERAAMLPPGRVDGHDPAGDSAKPTSPLLARADVSCNEQPGPRRGALRTPAGAAGRGGLQEGHRDDLAGDAGTAPGHGQVVAA